MVIDIDEIILTTSMQASFLSDQHRLLDIPKGDNKAKEKHGDASSPALV
jgi:hypothetical protein